MTSDPQQLANGFLVMNKCTSDGEDGPWLLALFSLIVTLSGEVLYVSS